MVPTGNALQRLYTFGSLANTRRGVHFRLKNRLIDAELTGLRRLTIDETEVPLTRVGIDTGGGVVSAGAVSATAPVAFPRARELVIEAEHGKLPPGEHEIEIAFDCRPFGTLQFRVRDALPEPEPALQHRIPRHTSDDYLDEVVEARRAFARDFADAHLDHLFHPSFEPHLARGHCEHYVGAAQIPVGIAGPLRIEGEHARGEFLIPLATTEGTLVASYNRGMQALNRAGGVRCTILGDGMQRAPVFVLADARRARAFAEWVATRFEPIRAAAESTSRVAKLESIQPYVANRYAYLVFDYATGDAAGQNMVTLATSVACSWIVDHFEGIERYFLGSNLEADKKAAHVNLLRPRGKRVVAEATLPRDVLVRRLRVEPETLTAYYHAANIGATLAGSNNNGGHSANAVAALFIATGQDPANVAEASAAVISADTTSDGALYLSITIPSLIVATYGGGTGLPTQRECLELLGCFGAGNVRKFAEIAAGVVLAGELSLASAIAASEWVSAHERYGRHR